MGVHLTRICVLDANKLKDRTKWKSRYTRLFAFLTWVCVTVDFLLLIQAETA